MIEKLSVAILIWGLSNGGAERAAGLLSMYLSKYYRVFIFLKSSENITYDYAGEIVCIGEGDDWELIESIKREKRNNKIICSISFLFEMNYYNVMSYVGDRIILSVRNNVSGFRPPNDFEIFCVRNLYKYADRTVAVSKGVEWDLINNHKMQEKKVLTIYNLINKEKIRNQAEEGMICEDSKRTIVCIGRLLPQKNYRRILNQFAIIKSKRNDIKIVIVGSGELKGELQESVNSLGIKDDVCFVSYCKNPFMYLKSSDVLLMASWHEGLPNVILEAMCLEVPIVTTDCKYGPRELLSDEYDYGHEIKGIKPCKRGVIVEDAVTDDNGLTHYLAEGVEYILDNKDYVNEIKSNQKKYIDKYSNEHIVNKWKCIIEDSINNNETEYYSPLFDPKKRVMVYGAGKKSCYIRKKCKEKNITISLFAVSDKTNNPPKIDGISVVQIDEVIGDPNSYEVVIGISIYNCNDVLRKLYSLGYKNIHFL